MILLNILCTSVIAGIKEEGSIHELANNYIEIFTPFNLQILFVSDYFQKTKLVNTHILVDCIWL